MVNPESVEKDGEWCIPGRTQKGENRIKTFAGSRRGNIGQEFSGKATIRRERLVETRE